MKHLFQTKSQFVLLLLLLFCFSLSLGAENPGKKKKKGKEQTEYKGDVGTTITLVTSGMGETQEEATKNALRSALEQTYGTFVSSNSKVVDDELVSDEIVSISTGNIAKYEILSITDSRPVEVTTKAVVSISNLQSYAQNKGMSAELAGNTFAMNLKIEELNKKNQNVALSHLLEQTKEFSKELFDYELSVSNPEKTSAGVQVLVTIRIKANSNTLAYYDLFHNTLTSLAVQKKKGSNGYTDGAQGFAISGIDSNDKMNGIDYILRGDYKEKEPSNTLNELKQTLHNAILNCEIVDNLNNVSGFSASGHNKAYTENVLRGFFTTNKLYLVSEGGTGRSYGVRAYRDGYGFNGNSPLTSWRENNFANYHWLNAARPVCGEKLFELALFLR